MKNKPNSKLVAIYTRVSDNNSSSIADQIMQCQKFCEEQGLEVAQVFTATGSSVGTEAKKTLGKCIEFCRAKKNSITALITSSLDRITRNATDYVAISKTLSDKGVALLSIRESNAGPELTLTDAIADGIADLQDHVNSELSKKSLREKRARKRTV